MSESLTETVTTSTNVPAPKQGPNSRVRMGESVLAVIRTQTPSTQEVPRVN